MDELQTYAGLGSAPFISAIVEVLKPWMPDKRWYPLAAIVLGVAWNIGLWIGTGSDPRLAVVYGLVAGLAAAGVYSAAGSLRGRGT